MSHFSRLFCFLLLLLLLFFYFRYLLCLCLCTKKMLFIHFQLESEKKKLRGNNEIQKVMFAQHDRDYLCAPYKCCTSVSKKTVFFLF